MNPGVAQIASSRDLSRNRRLSAVLWRAPLALLIAGMIWTGARGPLWAVGFTWIGAACTVNAFRCRRVHCAIMGPGFLALGLASLARATGLVAVGWNALGGAAVVVVGVAYLPEILGWKYFGTPRCGPEAGFRPRHDR